MQVQRGAALLVIKGDIVGAKTLQEIVYVCVLNCCNGTC